MHYFRKRKLWSIHSTPLDPKWCLGVVRCLLLTFSMWKLQNLCLILNALFHGTEIAIHPFQSIGPKMMFGRVSEHFTNLWHVKWWNTCVLLPKCTILGYRSSEASNLLHCPKMMFRVFHCILLTLCTLKDAKLVFKPDCTISGYKSCEASVLSHWTQNSRKRWKTCVRARMH
jgi:hypothetical protein